MAGPHQIWKMPLDESEIGPYAGNGREDIVDGRLLPQDALRPRVTRRSPSPAAWPPTASGSTWPTAKAARSAPSPSIPARKCRHDRRHDAGSLFTFGDVDGDGDEVRLQHAWASSITTACCTWPTRTTTRSR